jgi:hypothetical protein
MLVAGIPKGSRVSSASDQSVYDAGGTWVPPPGARTPRQCEPEQGTPGRDCGKRDLFCLLNRHQFCAPGRSAVFGDRTE